MDMDIMEERKIKNNTVLLTIIAIATLLVAMAGATFAFFAATVNSSNADKSIQIKTATIGITYNHGTEVSVENLMPGGTIDSKVVTIENTSTDYAAKYTLEWAAGVTNEFTRPQDFTYLVTCEGTGAPTHTRTQLPATGTTPKILDGIDLPANTTHTCTFTFQYDFSSDVNQNEDQNKTFNGNFKIVADQLPPPTP